MNAKIQKLLEEIEPNSDAVHTSESSEAVINGNITLDREACEKLLQSAETVTRLFDALGSPKNAQIELYSVELENHAFDQLEELFDTVDVY